MLWEQNPSSVSTFKGPLYGFRDAGIGLCELGTRGFRGTLYQPENSLGGRETLFVSFLGGFCDLIDIIHKMGFNLFFCFRCCFWTNLRKRKKNSEEKNTVWFQRGRKELIYCFRATRVGEHETCVTGQILLVGNCAFPYNFFIERDADLSDHRLCYYFNRLFVFPLYRISFHLINRVVPNNPENGIHESTSE